MALHADNFTIALTPSLILDGHYPDGNDGSGAIPLTWGTVLDITGQQVGTPYSDNLFTRYLTQPGGNTAVASLLSGTLSAGWALASDGTLSWDGTGVLDINIQVRATRAGFTSDSNFFRIQSVAVIPNPDTLAPTIPTGLALVSKTATQINVTCDAPSDVPTTLVAASGMKEVRFFKNGVFDGSPTAVTGGRSVALVQADVGASSGRRFVGGWYTAVDPSQRNGVVATAAVKSTAGPLCANTKGALFRHNWNELEPTPNTFNLAAITKELNWCAAAGVMYFVMVVGRTFNGVNPMPGAGQGAGGTDIDLALKTYTFTNPLGKLGYQCWWWDPTVLNRYGNLAKKIGALCDSNSFFAGISTQETSIGTPSAASNYTLTSFKSALISMSNFIAAASPNSRHFFYFNDIHGGGTSDLEDVVAAIWHNGAIIGGPDAVLGGSLTTGPYKLQKDYQDGTHTTGSTVMPGTGPTFNALQPAEWENKVPANNPAGTIKQRFQYSTGATVGGVATPYPSSYPRNTIFMSDWHTAVSGAGTEKFNPAISDLTASNPTFGPFVAPASMVPGSSTQSGVDYTVTGAGTGIGTSADQWSVIRVPSNGNFSIIAKLNGITGTNTASAFAGLTIREDTTAAATAAHLYVSTTQIRSRYRGASGVPVTDLITVAGKNWSTAKWLKLSRSGNNFSWFWSADGLAWTAIGTAVITMQNAVQAELFACSGIATTVTASFQQVNVQNLANATHSYTGLTTATPYVLTAVSRDIAINDSLMSPILNVTTS